MPPTLASSSVSSAPPNTSCQRKPSSVTMRTFSVRRAGASHQAGAAAKVRRITSAARNDQLILITHPSSTQREQVQSATSRQPLACAACSNPPPGQEYVARHFMEDSNGGSHARGGGI